MGFYARRRGKFVAQVVTDLLVVAWCVSWGFVGHWLRALILSVNGPLADTSTAAGRLREQFRTAGDEASQVPAVGDSLRRPFDGAAESLANIVASIDQQMITIERVGDVAGWLVFLIPVTIVAAVWLPLRIRFFRLSRAAQRFIDGQADLELFALRAMTSQPMHVLAKISEDPVAGWRRGDQAVIGQLAEVELRRAGLKMPVDKGPTSIA